MKKIILFCCVLGLAVMFFAFNNNEHNDYTVIENNNLAAFNYTVQGKLSAGWKLAGGVAMSQKGFYMQAMYK